MNRFSLSTFPASRAIMLAGASLTVTLGMGGCEQAPPRPRPLSGPTRLGTAQPRLDGQIGTQRRYSGVASYAQANGAARTTNENGPGDITLNFANTDIRTVADQILGDIQHVNYTIDPAVQGTATLRTSQPLRRDQLLPVLRSLLTGANASLIEENGLYRIVPAAGGPSGVGRGAAAQDGEVAVPLRYASATALAKVLEPFQQNGGHVAAAQGSNTLIINGDPATRQSLVDLVRSFDTDALAGQSYALLPTNTGNAQELGHALETALASGKEGVMRGQVQVLAMPRIDSVLVIARNPRLLQDAQRVFTLIEAGRRKTVRVWNVFYLQNGRANDVAYVLQQAFTPDHVTASPTPHNSTIGKMSNFLSQGSGQGNPGGGLGGSGFGGGGASSMPGQQGANDDNAQNGSNNGQNQAGSGSGSHQDDDISSNPLLGGLGNMEDGQGSRDTVRIIPDMQNNAILVYATQEELGSISAMLHKIDIVPLQVRIDATVAEVTLNDNLKYGTQFFFKSGGINGILSAAGQTLGASNLAASQLASNFPGFVLGGSDQGGAPFVINLLQNVTTVQVLSSPQIMVMDNQPASLMVGDLVPYLTGATTSVLTSNSTITNTVSYQPTGVILQVTPHVSNGDLVTLDVSQQVSSVASPTTTTNGSNSINSPTFSQRQVTSRVEISDGQTVGLAGLITDNRQRGNQGIPWMKDIPILGLLGGQQTNTRTRTELLVLITPHVIHSQSEAAKLTEDMREALPRAATLHDTLKAIPASGSSDPQHRILHAIGLKD
ncbi:type II secretion system secretin GspD [Brytella acorum]|uniref:Type II secretion system secretin GspD n=1 Tax=Brytella acorum TaxID=2959299 RepID=A0AA35UHG6_9PROT|nr:type II secretion system secretin GspD [Brytella acorum]MDF3624856.1 type II secretion system secretin GspD [Brytella acorum]CAI9120159.1 type II secretion system secretin GspD [Brytella acorum]